MLAANLVSLSVSSIKKVGTDTISLKDIEVSMTKVVIDEGVDEYSGLAIKNDALWDEFSLH